MNIGDHLVSTRIGYSHHGIYIGSDQVIHYSGFANDISNGEIEIASLAEFSRGNNVSVKEHLIRRYAPDESVSRAYSRLGEDWYNVLLNNCEHFVTWCIMGFHSSSQVNLLIANVSRVAANVSSVAAAEKLLQLAATRQAPSIIASTLYASAAKTTVSSSAGTVAGLATGAGIASSTGATTAIVAGITATSAAPFVATAVAALGVGYGVKKVVDWFMD